MSARDWNWPVIAAFVIVLGSGIAALAALAIWAWP